MVNPDHIFGRLGNRMFQGAYIYSQMREGKIPDFYVQDYTYFHKYRNDIREWFGDGISPVPQDFVAIHVRRGDYVNNNFYVDLTQTDYYEKAMAEFPNSKFVVFSDDIDFCKDYFEGDEYEFNQQTEVGAMNTMASARGIIMANSSFSWWAAYLSRAKVVCPANWFTDELQRCSLLEEWIKI